MHILLQLATSRSVPSIIHTQVPQMCMQNDENSSKIQLQNYTNIETHKYEKNEKKINHQICSIHYSCLSAADTEQEQQILDFPKPSKYELSLKLSFSFNRGLLTLALLFWFFIYVLWSEK